MKREGPTTRDTGAFYEDMAASYLEKLGYKIVDRNVRIGSLGELDIIARDGTTLVFVEVRAREKPWFATAPEDSIGPRKRTRIKLLSRAYLQDHEITGTECRIDVIGIDDFGKGPQLRHYIDAFV
jgi:putative endonuclease